MVLRPVDWLIELIPVTEKDIWIPLVNQFVDN